MKQSSSKQRLKRLLGCKKPNLIVKIFGLKCSVAVNPEVYSEEDLKNLKELINCLSKEIWIDKTYVCFKGNRWDDAFITENGWYGLTRKVVKSNFGKNSKDEEEAEIVASLLTISITYLYHVAEKYGYDVENIEIGFKKNSTFNAIYEEDLRTEWNF